MYDFALLLHSWLRWVVVIAGLGLLGRSLIGWMGNKQWGKPDRALSAAFLHSFNLQFVLGLLLYFGLSPLVRDALQNMGSAMKEPVARYWAVEHIFTATVAIGLAHIGLYKVPRLESSLKRHRRTALTLIFVMLLIAVSIPWPFLPQGRPLFRLSF